MRCGGNQSESESEEKEFLSSLSHSALALTPLVGYNWIRILDRAWGFVDERGVLGFAVGYRCSFFGYRALDGFFGSRGTLNFG